MVNIYLAQAGIKNPVVSGLANKEQGQAAGIFGNWIGAIIGVFLIVGALWAFFKLITGAIGWISSGGESEKLQKAQGEMRDAIIGLIVLFTVWATYLLVLQWLGVGTGTGGGLELKFPTLF